MRPYLEGWGKRRFNIDNLQDDEKNDEEEGMFVEAR